MSTNVSITTTYAGEFARKYVSQALLAAPTIANGLISVKPNVKYKEVLKRVNTGSLLANGTCDFTPTGTISLVERILEPKELQVNQVLCKKSFRTDWEAIEMGVSAYDNLPPTFADFIIAEYVAKVAAENEINIWRGVEGQGAFDGIMTKLAVDASLPVANEIAGTTVTASNVVAELEKIFNAIPNTLYGRDDLYIGVSTNIYKAYLMSLGGFAANGVGANGYDNKGLNQSLQDLFFAGVKIVMLPALANNTAICTYVENLYFGTGLISDHNEIQVIDTSETLGDQNVRLVMRMTGGVQYAIVEDIVTYGITNSANDPD
jgi:hypothetical protein